MDWPRARAILLATFTIVNTLLAWRLWGGGPSQPLSDEGLATFQLSEAHARLAEQGFRLATTPKPSPPVHPLLRISPPEGAWLEMVGARLAAVRREPGDTVQRQEDGVVTWTAGAPLGPGPRSGERGARDAALAFLRAAGLRSLTDLMWSRSEVSPGGYWIEFVPVRDGLPVYTGWVRVAVGPGGVTEARVLLPRMGDPRGELKGVLAPTEALLRLAGHLAASGIGGGRPDPRTTFTGVQLGYYAPRPPGAKSWDAVAVWRVLTASGDAYYVNAFTGELIPERGPAGGGPLQVPAPHDAVYNGNRSGTLAVW